MDALPIPRAKTDIAVAVPRNQTAQWTKYKTLAVKGRLNDPILISPNSKSEKERTKEKGQKVRNCLQCRTTNSKHSHGHGCWLLTSFTSSSPIRPSAFLSTLIKKMTKSIRLLKNNRRVSQQLAKSGVMVGMVAGWYTCRRRSGGGNQSCCP